MRRFPSSWLIVNYKNTTTFNWLFLEKFFTRRPGLSSQNILQIFEYRDLYKNNILLNIIIKVSESYITNTTTYYITVSDGKVFSFIKTFVSLWWISVRNVFENISLMWARDAFKLMNKSLMQKTKTKCKQLK